MNTSNTLLSYETTIEMKTLEKALDMFFNGQAIQAIEFMKSLLIFKGVKKEEWPQYPYPKKNEREDFAESNNQYFFSLYNFYCQKARVLIDEIRMSMHQSDDIPDVLKEQA